ncbi:peptidoglycan-binding protein [Streptomyces sp. NBC_00249]|uniref:peptidoglycan-binding protein n=1 Tax=Streptomyces sp. NBC_00249 TaxID=2975690 RepID=UPI002257679F|nr:peptidoglycan-binding protein [Streptomyces sp. NBC_00249]MCX5196083.1 peptidoglycan-binding protein [Streptomyces sp. NBC_00249]
MTGTAADLIRAARGEIGYQEGNDDGDWNNIQKFSPAVPDLEWSQGQAWCATFVAWCARESGNESLFPVSASCAEGVSWFAERDRFTEYPVIGGQVFFGSGGGSHTGICIAYTGSTITTIEGNTNDDGSAEGDGVYLKTRDRTSNRVYGYGIPDFPEGVVLADPAWKGRPGAVYFAEEASESDLSAGPTTPSSPHESARDDSGDGGDDGGYEPFPGAEFFHPGQDSPVVTRMGERLVAEGCSAYAEGPGPQWSDADRESFRNWQHKLGDTGADADGIPGPKQWSALKVPRA